MPLAQLYQFSHCALLYAGCATDWKNRTEQEQATVRAWLSKRKN